MSWKNLPYWLRGGIKGAGIVIIAVVIVFVFQIFVRYLVFESGEYGRWNTCANQARNEFSETLRGPDGTFISGDIDVEKGYQNAVFSKCGQQPQFAHESLYDFGNNVEHLILKGELGVYVFYPLLLLIPKAGVLLYFLSDSPILLILLGFIAGTIIGWVYGKRKPKNE